jgi:hypothetical protein
MKLLTSAVLVAVAWLAFGTASSQAQYAAPLHSDYMLSSSDWGPPAGGFGRLSADALIEFSGRCDTGAAM